MRCNADCFSVVALIGQRDSLLVALTVTNSASISVRRQKCFRQPDPVSCSDRQQIIVEVIARIMQIAWSDSVTAVAVVAFSVSDKDVTAWLVQHHVGKVFACHRRFDVGVDLFCADDVLHHADREGGFFGVIDQRRITAHKFELDVGTKSSGGVRGDVVHAALDHIQHFHAEGAHGAAQGGIIRNYIDGAAGVDLGHRQYGGIVGVGIARDDGLPAQSDLCRHEHRVNALVRLRSVRTLTLDRDFKCIARRHDRAGAYAKTTDRHTRPVMHAEHGIHRALLEQTVLDHLVGAAAAFFRRLKNQIDGAVKITLLRQMTGCTEQHRSVAVMAAGMHFSGVTGRVRERVEFLHRQCVHVGTQADRTLALAIFKNADDTGAAQAAQYRYAPFSQFGDDGFGGAVFFVTQLRVRMQIAADLLDFRMKSDDGIDQLHGTCLCKLLLVLIPDTTAGSLDRLSSTCCTTSSLGDKARRRSVFQYLNTAAQPEEVYQKLPAAQLHKLVFESCYLNLIA